MTGSREAYKGDPLETVFSAMEVTCCPGSYKPEPTPDSLDFVFENVETFTCRNEEGKEPDVRYHELSSEIPSIQRDNSLVEFDEKGRQVPEPATRATKRAGGEKDALDFVFENVERYACNEKMPDDQEILRKVLLPTMVAKSPAHRVLHERLKVIEEADDDDEIQLYFRPKRISKKERSRLRERVEV